MLSTTVTPMSNANVSNVNAKISDVKCKCVNCQCDANVNSATEMVSHVLLQTTRESVLGKSGASEAIILFDIGSDKTNMSQELVDKIGPEWVGS